MAVELITGHSGNAHITSTDVAELIAGLAGSGGVILADPNWTASTARNDAASATLNGTSSVTIGTGEIIWDGRHVRVTEPVTLDIPDGQGSHWCYPSLHYQRVADIESVELVMTENITQGTIGVSSEAWLNVYAILVDGSTVNEPVCKLTKLQPYANVAKAQAAIDKGSVSFNGSVTPNGDSYDCWASGSCATIDVVDVKLKNSLANGANVVIGAVPSHFRPIKYCYVQTVTAGVWARVTTGGELRVSNRTGAAIAAGTKLTFTMTYAI